MRHRFEKTAGKFSIYKFLKSQSINFGMVQPNSILYMKKHTNK